MNRKLFAIIDSTLREGEQMPGIAFTDHARRSIIRNLHKVGIDEIELGIASPANHHIKQLAVDARKITRGACRLALWSRCREEDIIFSAACKPDVLSLSIPVSDLHIEKRLRKDRAWIRRSLAESIHLGFSMGIPYISVGLEDATRADPAFLRQVIRIAEKHGAQRVRLADTVGTCTPGRIQQLIELLKETVTCEIGVHCHNDFGMATANSIAAVEAGAKWLDATVLGLGERAGNCRLEEAVGFMALILNNSQYKPHQLQELCRYVAKAAGIPIAGNHPVVGEHIFTCETGLHQHGLAVNPETYEPYAPYRVGTTRKLRFGAKTGLRAINLQLSKSGLHLDDMQIRSLSDLIRSNEHALDEEQLFRLALQTIQNTPAQTGPGET